MKQNVSLAKGEPATHKVVGVCYKPNHKNTVHLLLSGATYGHLYWDFPLDPKRYSYVRALTNAGYATFNIARIGMGNFSHVISVGHSLGSGLAVLEAAKYDDVNGIVLTSFLHNQGPGFGDVAASVYPAQQAPRFADRNLPDGYLTALLGKQSIFFSKPNADSNVIALAKSMAETITIAEAQGFPPLVADLNNLQDIRVPVFIVMGQSDNITNFTRGGAVMSSIEDNKIIARRWLELINEHKLEEICEMTAPT